MASRQILVRKISESFIRPKHEVEESKEPRYLPPVALLFLSAHYMQKGFLFTKPSNFDIESFLTKLKHSLSFALVYFYPLAGRFETVKYEDEGACTVYLDCNKGPGARFIHASDTNVTVNDVVASEPHVIPIIRSFFELGEEDVINYDGHTRALLSIQVTELKDGVFVGFTMNHSVADGASFWHFVGTLSEIYRCVDNNDMNEENMSIKISRMPIHKQVFPDGYGPIIKVPCLDFKEFLTTRLSRATIDVNIRERFFHLSSTSIARLKAQANDEINSTGCHDHIIVSSFQALSALVWRSITRARNLGPDIVTTFAMVANARSRFEPPLSGNLFGNVIMTTQVSRKVDELLGNGLGWAALLINQAIEGLDDKAARDGGMSVFGHFLLKQPDQTNSSSLNEKHRNALKTTISMRANTKFNMYNDDQFGLGKAVAVRTGYHFKLDGKVTANPGPEGGGSLELEMALSPHTMSALERDQEFMSFVSSS